MGVERGPKVTPMTANYFNDSPIEDVADDQYGIAPFANALAKSILGMINPVGTTIAVNGPWGSGKSSAVNLIRNELAAAGDEQLTVVDFKCWWYRGEEALTLAFFQELNRVFKKGLGDKVKGLIPDIGKHVLQAGPVLGTAVSLATGTGVGSIISGSATFLKRFFPDDESLEKTFRKLSKALEAQDRRFLVIVDDIDRLSPEEALAIFRLVKSVGRLPNVMYLLVFDRQLADAAVAARYPSEGPHFLEKIIQASFELPAPPQTDLNAAVLSAVETFCGLPNEEALVRFMNVFYDAVAPYITSPRHVTRLVNAISVTWPPVANEVNEADYIALETLRLYEPHVYAAIRANREAVVGSGAHYHLSGNATDKFAPFLAYIPETQHQRLKVALQRLFPALENTTYGDGFGQIWDSERRVCVGKHFDTYFRLSLSDDALPADDLKEVLDHADEPSFVESRFRMALDHRRKNGRSMVPVLLDELTSHAARMDKAKVEPFLCSLFAIADEIRREEDKEQGFPSADAHLRMHWLIRRLTENRYTIDERTSLYLKATEKAALGWLVDFTASAIGDYKEGEANSTLTDKCLIDQTALPILKDRALAALRVAATDGSLIHTDHLVYALYRWKDFSNDDGAEMKAWLAEQMRSDTTLITLAKALTGESWTTGLGVFGLGDRVSRRHIRVQISDGMELFDPASFRAELERIVSENTVPADDIAALGIFLTAWDAGRAGRD